MGDTIRPRVEAVGFFDDTITDRIPPVILSLAGGSIEPVALLLPGVETAERIVDSQQALLDEINERALMTPIPTHDHAIGLGYYSSAGGFHAL